MVRKGGFLGRGGRKVDTIDYYTKRVQDLENNIKKYRGQSTKPASYGWISFAKIEWAHTADQALQKIAQLRRKKHNDDNESASFHVRLSPPPNDLVWPNLPLHDKARRAKRWMGRAIYWIFIFVWMIPVGALSATSNIVNLIRMLPNAEQFINDHSFLMGIIQSWFTPIVMAVFFYALPYFFRFLSQQQGYQTQTTLDRKVLTKLYIFFIINNPLVFTLASMLISIYGQIRSLLLSGTLESGQQSISDYVAQIAKNILDVSTFWINYVCIQALGITMEMAQVLPLVIITLRKWITRPSPRQLRELAQPPEFDYPQNYNLLLFFFTIALLYSAIALLVLPFALLYFAMATVVYKYMLMYIFVTKIESGGKIWPVLFQTIMTSTWLFQLFMIIILNLKGGHVQSYVLIPLPIITLLFQVFYYRRIRKLGSYLIDSWSASQEAALIDEHASATMLLAPTKSQDSIVEHEKPHSKRRHKKHDLAQQFKDPALHKKLLTPMVHEDVRHLLPQVYNKTHATAEILHAGIEMAHRVSNSLRHTMDLSQEHGFKHHHHHKAHKHNHRLTVLGTDDGAQITFCTLTEEEAVEQHDPSDGETDEDENPSYQPQNSERHIHERAQNEVNASDTGTLKQVHLLPSITISASGMGRSSWLVDRTEIETTSSSPIGSVAENQLRLSDEAEEKQDTLSAIFRAYVLSRRHSAPLPSTQVELRATWMSSQSEELRCPI